MSQRSGPGRRICIVLLSGMGDVVHGLPVVCALKRDDPSCHITWIVQSEPAPLLRPHPAVDDVITFDRKRGPREVVALWRRLRPRRFDLLLNFNIYFKAGIPTFIARAPLKLGFGRDRARDLVWLLANRRLPERDVSRVNKQEQFLEFLHYLNVAPEPLEWRIELSEDERRMQREYFGQLDRPIAAIVPTSGRPAKDWSVERFARLATALEREHRCRVILLGGPSAREAARARAIMAASEATPRFELGAELRRLVWLLDGSDLVIAPDTGPLHIARALGTPVIGLFAHTDPRRVGPYRAYEDLVVDRFNRAPDDAPGAAPLKARHAQMTLIQVEDVLERVERALERYVKVSPAREG